LAPLVSALFSAVCHIWLCVEGRKKPSRVSVKHRRHFRPFFFGKILSRSVTTKCPARIWNVEMRVKVEPSLSQAARTKYAFLAKRSVFLMVQLSSYPVS